MSNQLGRYELLEQIGHGATGRVWRARHVDTGAVVAVKVLRGELADDPEVRARFLNEGTVLTGRDLPGVVGVHATVVDEDRVGLVMDLIDGSDLRQLMSATGPLPPARACALLGQVAETLTVAHRDGLVHRDVKPENVLVENDPPGAGAALLSDFGLARVLNETASSRTRSHVFGTPHYVAPEVLRGERAGPEADVYALGVMLFETVVGWRPFRFPNPAALMQQHLQQLPTRPDGLPMPLWGLIEPCLAKDPQQRPTTAQLARQLHQLALALAATPALPRTDPPSDQEETRFKIPPMAAGAPNLGRAHELARRKSVRIAALTAAILSVATVATVAYAAPWASNQDNPPRSEAPASQATSSPEDNTSDNDGNDGGTVRNNGGNKGGSTTNPDTGSTTNPDTGTTTTPDTGTTTTPDTGTTTTPDTGTTTTPDTGTTTNPPKDPNGGGPGDRTCPGTGCDGKNPTKTVCKNDYDTVRTEPLYENGRKIAELYIRYSPNCGSMWATARSTVTRRYTVQLKRNGGGIQTVQEEDNFLYTRMLYVGTDGCVAASLKTPTLTIDTGTC